MKFTKEQALNLLEKWEQNDKEQSLKSTTFHNSYIPELNSVAFNEAIYEYFDNLKTLIQESKNNLVDEIFEELYYEITGIAESNINIYDIDLKNEAFEKIDYIFENHDEYFETFESKKTSTRAIVETAEYYIIEDFLFQFHDEFKKEFTKELELEQQNQMSI